MVNSEHFAKRLQKILEFYDISAATFAEAIEVGRSSISHILSGRNKPSLDFVMKVVQTYPEVEMYWLLNGKGSFPPSDLKEPKEKIPYSENEEKVSSSLSEVKLTEPNKSVRISQESSSKRVARVILLYEDGSFEAFEN